MSSAPKRFSPNYTVDDYQQWAGDWELIDGVPLAMSPAPFAKHSALATNISRILGNEIERVGCDCTVMVEADWIVNNHTVVRPDVIIVCDGIPDRHVESPPSLIVEVLSPSTAQNDRTFKFDLYEEQGVKYYLIADADKKSLEVFQLEQGRLKLMDPCDTYQLDIHPDCSLQLDGKLVFA